MRAAHGCSNIGCCHEDDGDSWPLATYKIKRILEASDLYQHIILILI